MNVMPEKKNQHFVPQFYLKNFASNANGKTINIFNMGAEKLITDGGVKQQASKDYFYGKDKMIEDGLGELETKSSLVFRKIIKDSYVPKYPSPDYILLLAFTVFLTARTEFFSDVQDEMLDKMVKRIFEQDPRSQGIDLSKVRVRYNNPPVFSLAVVKDIIPLTMDLNLKILVNKTEEVFVTSDNPVIRYNQFLEKRKPFGSNVAFAVKGLELMLPISPTMFALFYDSSVYKVGNKKDDLVVIDRTTDIRSLNILSCANAYKNVYFNHDISEAVMRDMYAQAKSYRNKHKASADRYQSVADKSDSLIHVYSEDLRMNLQFAT